VDDVDSRDFDTKDFGSEDLDEMIIYGESSAITPKDDEPIPFDDSDSGTADVSHSPLNLGSGAADAPATGTAGQTARTPATQTERTASADRITGAKTFFAKLHPGSIAFLDEQITNWLKANPGVVVKTTSTVTGPIQAKKTEPNMIVTIWY